MKILIVEGDSATLESLKLLSVSNNHIETQFYRAQCMESLSTLASGIAHDLNNILGPILTIAQLFRLQPLNLGPEEQERPL